MPTNHAPEFFLSMTHLWKLKKNSQSIVEYMQSIKKITDDLTLVRYPLNDDELVIHVLNGLGSEYKELWAAIRTQDASISFEDLLDKLLDQEIFLKRWIKHGLYINNSLV